MRKDPPARPPPISSNNNSNNINSSVNNHVDGTDSTVTLRNPTNISEYCNEQVNLITKLSNKFELFLF